MDELKRAYRKALPGRIAALEGARAAAASGDAEAAATIRRVAHSLRGSGGTYGFPEVSAAATAVEDAAANELPAALDALIAMLYSVVRGEGGIADILVIEDEAEHALIINASLGQRGHKVSVVTTAAEARRVLADGVPSLILLDLFLPDADGRTLLLELREQPATAEVPIIIISANSGVPAKAECFALGATGFLEKPLEPELLEALVGAQLRNVARPANPPRNTGRRILLVEDDNLVASVLKHRLDREGYSVAYFDDGLAALDALNEEFALAILDVKLPGMDGFDLLQRMRERTELAETPVIILTALGGERDVLRGFQLGANDYITKPFSPIEVIARVKRLLAK